MHYSSLLKQPICLDMQPAANIKFIVIWKSFMCSAVHAWYLGNRRLSSGSVCGTVVGILVRRSRCGCPLICVAQRRKVTTVLNAGIPLKLLTHSVTVKDITLTGLTLREEEGRMREGDLWKSTGSECSHPSLLTCYPSPFVTEPNLSKPLFQILIGHFLCCRGKLTQPDFLWCQQTGIFLWCELWLEAIYRGHNNLILLEGPSDVTQPESLIPKAPP